MALTVDEIALIERHQAAMAQNVIADDLADTYYNHEHLLNNLGLMPDELYRSYQSVVGWGGTAVDTWEPRSDIQSLSLPDSAQADDRLRQIWETNNLASELSPLLVDRYTYGRWYLSIGAGDKRGDLPIIRPECPKTMGIIVDERTRRTLSACKVYGRDELNNGPLYTTLLRPDETVWAEKRDGQWEEVDRNKHKLGRVPIVMSPFGRRSGGLGWRSAINATLRGASDSATRAVTNMNIASDAHGLPYRWATGVAKADFVDATGAQKPAWMLRADAIWATGKADAKFGNFESASLSNFETQMDVLIGQAAAAAKLPQRYFGKQTANPPSADAIRAEEYELVKFVERQNTQVGAAIGWALAVALKVMDPSSEWVDGSRIGVQWIDPATPTVAQREDALMKRRSQGIISREGYWDELGWDEARKAKERENLDREANDPTMARALDAILGTPDAA